MSKSEELDLRAFKKERGPADKVANNFPFYLMWGNTVLQGLLTLLGRLAPGVLTVPRESII
ncbi:MAG TPA: hypothetical protein VME23_11135 [Terracidiphilus sp.]|nr:hypothetical protein [Terracidiphilus sp.]